jgi:hypothetical protein
MCLSFSVAANAATPTISNVTGTVSTGQILTIKGASMVQESIASVAGGTYGFEGSGPSSDGWCSDGVCHQTAYDSSIVLSGSKDLVMSAKGATSTGSSSNYNGIMYPKQNAYFRGYFLYHNTGDGTWPTANMKLFDFQGSPYGVLYLQPEGNGGAAPTKLHITALQNGAQNYSVGVNFPTAVAFDKWYCIEAYLNTPTSGSNSGTFSVWIDGVQVQNNIPVDGNVLQFFSYGWITLWSTGSGFGIDTHLDNLTFASTRIYPSTTVEISNSATYGSGTRVYQNPVSVGQTPAISDSSITVSANLTGLGSGPYYLWVTNNGQSRSTAYNLSGGGSTGTVDTTPPTVAISSPAAGTVSKTVSITAQATDNVGVIGVQYMIDGANVGTQVSVAPFTSSWDTSLYQDGTHILTAIARDAAGNSTTSAPVSVTVSNATAAAALPVTAATLFEETFADTNFSQRGWYDNTAMALSTTEHMPGSISSAALTFTAGGNGPTSGGSMRKLFTETDSIYVSYWQKYSSNWIDQAGGVGHHEIYLLTNQDGAYSNLAFTHLTGYLESWGTAGQAVSGTPHVTFQDGANIDQTKISIDLTKTTESRSANGCNGLLDSYFTTTCYNSGTGTYWNGKYLSGTSAVFTLGQWHHVEAYIKLNSIVNGKGVTDGTVTYWLDGQQIISNTNVLMRTGQYPNMKFNQIVIAPWLGNGSPGNQSFWLDDLLVATSKPGSITSPSPPTNLRVK